MDIFDTMITGGPAIFYDPRFRNVLEDHMSFLRMHPSNRTIDIEPGIAYKYAGDFFGLMQQYGISSEFHWPIMRVNDYISPQDYKDTDLTFIRPDETILMRLSETFRSHNKIRS